MKVSKVLFTAVVFSGLLIGTLAQADPPPPTKVTVLNCALERVTLRGYNGGDDTRTQIYPGSIVTLEGIDSIIRSDSTGKGSVECDSLYNSFCWVKFTCDSNTPCNEKEFKLDDGNHTFRVNQNKDILITSGIKGC